MPRPHGQIRQSQMIMTYGPGALVDLPHYAAVIGGLDTWRWGGDDRRRQILEPRLTAKIEEALSLQGLKLYEPPADDPEPGAPPSGVTAYEFPEWFAAQIAMRGPNGERTRPLIHRQKLVGRNKYQGPDRKMYPVVPVRFVQACINGHMSDIGWYSFVHGQGDPCRRELYLDERGTGGDLSEIEVRCECGRSRALILLLERGANALGRCHGQRPWLGESHNEQCRDADGNPAYNRLLIRSASNAYFPQILSVISIPDEDERLQAAVGKIWEDFLQYVDTADDLARERKKARVHAALEGYSDDIIWLEIQRRRGGAGNSDQKKIKVAEIETLLSSTEEIGEDKLEGVFYARSLKRPATESNLWKKIDRVVLVHRLREVIAQIGFTRFEPAVSDIDGELNLGVRSAQLAEEVKWLPAVENRGEGVFISFRKDVISAWRQRAEVQKREIELFEGFKLWRKRHPNSTAQFPGVSYLMLHSLSHLLITTVALECGYSSSAIRERVYAGDAGYGILLYTGTPDSEGTLGGLVHVGRRIEEHLRNAIELGRLCSNDPVCAQHSAKQALEEQYLLGAACHGCLLIAETSCERFNQYLDRSLVVSTVGNSGAEFFTDSDLG
jgi:Domain of unknown function (DUF1998)